MSILKVSGLRDKMHKIITILILGLVGCTTYNITHSKLYDVVVEDLRYSENPQDLQLVFRAHHSPIITFHKDTIHIQTTKNSFALQSRRSKKFYIIDHNGTDQYRIVECDSTWKVVNYGFGVYR
jgi:hypothetical protein